MDPEMSRVRKLTSKPCRFACWQSTAPPRATFWAKSEPTGTAAGAGLVGSPRVVFAVEPSDEDFTSPDVGSNRRIRQTCITQLTLKPGEFTT